MGAFILLVLSLFSFPFGFVPSVIVYTLTGNTNWFIWTYFWVFIVNNCVLQYLAHFFDYLVSELTLEL